MGRATHHKPKKLSQKLLAIRLGLGLSQNELIRKLNVHTAILQASISGYELGTRVPPPKVLLEYARIAGVCTDVLIDDDADLPKTIPATRRHKYNSKRTVE